MGDNVTSCLLQQMGQCFNLIDGCCPTRAHCSVRMAFVGPGKETNHVYVSRPEHVMCPEPLTWAGAVPWRPWGLAHPGSRGGLLALTLRRRKQDSLPTSPRGQTPTWQSPLGCVPALCPYLPGTRPLCEEGLVSLHHQDDLQSLLKAVGPQMLSLP